MQSDRSAVALQRQDGRVSSSPALSTPPDSPVSFTHPQHHGSLGKNPRPLPDGVDFSHDLSPSQQRLAPASNTAASANALTITENNNYNKFNLNTNNKSTTASVKKPRKKREQPAADANVEDRPKEKKARKPREPRNQQNQHRDALAQKDPAQKTMVPTQNGGEITLSSNNVASNSYPHTTSAVARTSPETLRPASSGQHFDPVRSVSIEAGSSASKAMNSTSPAPAVRSPPARTGSTASATASIHSLIDPFPALSSSSVATKSTLPSLSSNGARQPSTVGSNPLSPSRQSHAFGMLASASTSTSNTAMPKPATPQHSALSANGRMTPTKKVDAAVAPPSDAVPGPQDSMAMEIDTPATANTNAAMLPAKTPDAPSTHNGATPPSSKSNRQKEVSLPPLPGTSGTGLLNPASAPPNGAYAVNICLHFDLRGKESLTFSFAREVEKKYGRDALHPRRAAHRDRMARMAAATAALEKDSSVAGGSGSAQDGSDLSELDQDNDQEMEIDSNAEGGPMDGAANGNFDANSGLKTGRGSRRKRRPNKNEYNLDDDFIDDAELAWEEQAAVATGGFFVYSGPLVPEGEKPAVERADGTTKRGRGRGRGGSARGDSNAGTHGNSTRGDAAGGGRGSRGGRGGRGGGRGGGGEGGGSRNDRDGAASHPASATNGAANGGTGSGTGSGASRKPRISKAEKAERTAEKEREKAEKLKLKEIKKEEKAAAKVSGKAAALAPANLAAAAAAGSNGNLKDEPAQIQFQSELQFQPQPQSESELRLQDHHHHHQNQHPPGGLLTSLKSADG